MRAQHVELEKLKMELEKLKKREPVLEVEESADKDEPLDAKIEGLDLATAEEITEAVKGRYDSSDCIYIVCIS
jgi:hypothetical protein